MSCWSWTRILFHVSLWMKKGSNFSNFPIFFNVHFLDFLRILKKLKNSKPVLDLPSSSLPSLPCYCQKASSSFLLLAIYFWRSSRQDFACFDFAGVTFLGKVHKFIEYSWTNLSITGSSSVRDRGIRERLGFYLIRR